MRKHKNTSNTNEQHLPTLRVVESPNEQAHVEMEIERHVKSIRALIKKLRPVERQRYFDGLLAHILDQPVDYPQQTMNKNANFDYCNLSVNDLTLIRELSVKMHELYRISESDE